MKSPEKLTPVTKRHPCPVCQGDHKCSTGDRGLIICGRQSGPVFGFAYIGPSKKDDQFHLYRAEDPDKGRRSAKRQATPTDWSAITDKYAAAFVDGGSLGDPRRKLAKDLALPVEVFDLLPGIGANQDDPKGTCWTFPERDATGTVIGINRRFLNGKKEACHGSSRGLSIPTGWRDRPGPVLVVEGASDTLALTAAGLAAIGRPNNTGGAELLAELFRKVPADRPIIVMGENDRKPSGKWPGQEGVNKVAPALAGKLGRPVLTAFPPGDAKDVRAWLVARTKAGVTWTDAGSELTGLLTATTAEAKPILPPPTPPVSYALTDMGNARRLIDQHGRDLRYSHPQDIWYIWNGWRWAPDDTGEVVRRAKRTVITIFNEAADADSQKAREAIGQHAVKSQSSRSLSAMIQVARSEPGIPVCLDDLDADPWLFNCPNGTIDLRTGELRGHRREDAITQMGAVPYEPNAPCPLWESFLAKVFPADVARPDAGGHTGLIGYVRRLFGYGLTGDIREHTLPIFWGGGSNGKSTLIETAAMVFGANYWAAAPDGMLMVRRSEAHPTELARLYRKRLVAATETDEGQRLNASLVKRLTGGDTVTARFMREDFFEFRPTHKLLMCTNDRPRIPSGGHAIWRRVALIPFGVKFWKSELGEIGPEYLRANQTLPEQLKAELPGILAWMVRGCLEWQTSGLQPPDEVRVATDEYRTQQNTIGSFIAEKCEITNREGAETTMKELYAAYCQWASTNGEAAFGKIRFNEAVQRENVKRGRNHSNVDVWQGLTLNHAVARSVADVDDDE